MNNVYKNLYFFRYKFNTRPRSGESTWWCFHKWSTASQSYPTQNCGTSCTRCPPVRNIKVNQFNVTIDYVQKYGTTKFFITSKCTKRLCHLLVSVLHQSKNSMCKGFQQLRNIHSNWKQCFVFNLITSFFQINGTFDAEFSWFKLSQSIQRTKYNFIRHPNPFSKSSLKSFYCLIKSKPPGLSFLFSST